MTSVIPEAPPVAPSRAPLATEQEAREVAEAAREKEWASAKLRAGVVRGHAAARPHPSVSRQSDAGGRCEGRPFMDRLERFLAERVDSDQIDREGKIPPEVVQGLREHRRVRHQDPRGVRRPRAEPDELYPCHRPGHQRGRQPHRAAVGGPVHRRAAAAQAVRHRGAEGEVPPAPRKGRDLAPSRSPRSNVG